LLPLLIITLFFGGISIGSVAGILWGALKYFIVLFLIVLIKNTNPRLRIDQALRFFWFPVTGLAVLSFILAVMGY